MNIVFAHNVYDRMYTLRDTILIEKQYFPEASVSVACNNTFVNIFQGINKFSVVHFNEREHKIGCVNGCILSIKQLLNIDFDVLIFSHDDVFINRYYFNVVEKHIKSIVDGEYDLICRKPLKYNGSVEIYGGYYIMEAFFMSKNAVIKVFTNAKTLNSDNDIPRLFNSPAPEVWFYDLVSNKELKINEIRYLHETNTYNKILGETIGFCHKNAGRRGWKD